MRLVVVSEHICQGRGMTVEVFSTHTHTLSFPCRCCQSTARLCVNTRRGPGSGDWNGDELGYSAHSVPASKPALGASTPHPSSPCSPAPPLPSAATSVAPTPANHPRINSSKSLTGLLLVVGRVCVCVWRGVTVV